MKKEKSYKEILSNPKDVLKALPIAMLYDICIVAMFALILPYFALLIVLLAIQFLMMLLFDWDIKYLPTHLIFYPPVKLEKWLFKDEHDLFVEIWHFFKIVNAVIIAIAGVIFAISNGYYWQSIVILLGCGILFYISVVITGIAINAYFDITDEK